MVTRPLPRHTGRRRLGVVSGERLADLGEQIVAHHVVAEIDRVGEAFGVGAAVALDDDAVEAEEDAAVRLARIHLVAERAECAARQQVAEPGRQRAVHLALEDLAELAGGALGRLERDIAGKAFGHHHVDRPLADVVALDEAGIFDLRPLTFAQDAAGLAHLFEPLDLLDADIEQPDRRPLEAEQHPRHGAAHGREVDEMRGVGADRGAEVEHDRFARAASATARRSPAARCRAMVRRLNLAIAISAPVLPAETAASASPFLTASMASHMEDFQRPLRSAWLGLSCILTETSVWTSCAAALSRGRASSSGSTTARSPNRRNSMPGWRVSDSSAPGTTTAAPWSPPMASSAMRTLWGMNRRIPCRQRTQQGAIIRRCVRLCPFFSAASAANGLTERRPTDGPAKTAPGLRG